MAVYLGVMPWIRQPNWLRKTLWPLPQGSEICSSTSAASPEPWVQAGVGNTVITALKYNLSFAAHGARDKSSNNYAAVGASMWALTSPCVHNTVARGTRKVKMLIFLLRIRGSKHAPTKAIRQKEFPHLKTRFRCSPWKRNARHWDNFVYQKE